jgi:hypothetical protein
MDYEIEEQQDAGEQVPPDEELDARQGKAMVASACEVPYAGGEDVEN